MKRMLAVGLGVVLAMALLLQGLPAANAADKGKSAKKKGGGTIAAAGLYGMGDLAERSYKKDSGKKVRGRGKRQ